MSDTDLELLARYTRGHAEDAFSEVVRRHLGLVYSAALRQVRSPQLAEEVAQSTFIKLAGHAHRLAPDTILSAWLYEVTRRTAIDVVRGEVRRQLREKIAVEMNTMNATADDWTQIEPFLDDAMRALDDTDRTAVLLRFFENKSLREVGETLGTTDDTARKRVNRAVERLRGFFAKRGVTVGSSGLVVVISANAVQAAPAGLAVTISAAAAFAGTTIATTTTATATKAIAMTATQKVLIVATLAAAVGTGIYKAREASTLRTQVQTLQQQTPLTEQLTRERDEAAGQLAALRSDSESLGRATAELVKLRGEVTRLKSELQERAQRSARGTNDQTLSEAVAWKNRVNQLKQYMEQIPAAKIPELQFVTEEDWLNAANRKLNTERDYRQALSFLRGYGEIKVANMLQKALRGYLKANNEQFPTDLIQLQPYFESPVDEALLQRWQIVSAATVQNYGLGGNMVITQKAPVDDVFDTGRLIGSASISSRNFLDVENAALLNPVRQAFKAAHGWFADNDSLLLPYATTPEQQAALQKYIFRDSSPK
jgi:RNA polymerase sigma factor (sigma-70 family)